jgi:hypothetical protein
MDVLDGHLARIDLVKSQRVQQCPLLVFVQRLFNLLLKPNQRFFPSFAENRSVGANFQGRVLGGVLFDLAHGEEYAKAQQEVYEQTRKGSYGSPGMLMGFVSYASIVSQEELKSTISDIRANSLAKTNFEKAQEEVQRAPHYSAPLTHFCQLIIEHLSDPTFANIQTFCIPYQLDMSAGSDRIQFFSKPPEGKNRVSLLICLEHPLSHGSVHITSADPLTPPRIGPRYFRNGADAKILAVGLK